MSVGTLRVQVASASHDEEFHAMCLAEIKVLNDAHRWKPWTQNPKTQGYSTKFLLCWADAGLFHPLRPVPGVRMSAPPPRWRRGGGLARAAAPGRVR